MNSWSSILGVGKELDSKFPAFWLVKSTQEYTRGDTETAWLALLEDFDCMALGVDSDTRAPLLFEGDQWSQVLLFGKGDMEVNVLEWGLPSYNAGDEMCGFCTANRTTRRFTNLQENAPWRPSEAMTDFEFVSRLTIPRHVLAASHYCSVVFSALTPCIVLIAAVALV